MEIVVTKHAINRYRQRMFDYITPDKKIDTLLKNVARNGKQVYLRPSSHGHCIEVQYNDISVVILNESTGITVMTCLGDHTYRKWVKNKENQNIYGRLMYPERNKPDSRIRQSMLADTK